MSIAFWLQFPHFLVNGESYHKAEIISNHFKKAWHHLTSKLTRSHSISPCLRCGGVEDLHCGGEADKSAQCYLISMSHSLSEWAKISEGWNLSVTILYQKQRKHKWMKCLKLLPPFLRFCENIWHYNLKMWCNSFNAHYKYCYHYLYYYQYHYLTFKSLFE